MSDNILEGVNTYYTNKLIRNGATPAGVDWNSTSSQELRFDILSGVISADKPFSILDYGCGFGSMYGYLKKKISQDFTFTGVDLSAEMISEAKKIYKSDLKVCWFTKLPEKYKADFVIASGIFNVKFADDEEWLKYIIDTLHQLDKVSVKGFSFNALTKYSDAEFMKSNLFYADPAYLFDYCKVNFSKYVQLRHDYPLYEFSIIVRK